MTVLLLLPCMSVFILFCSLACQPLHLWKEGLASLTQHLCTEWVELTHKHTFDSAFCSRWLTYICNNGWYRSEHSAEADCRCKSKEFESGERKVLCGSHYARSSDIIIFKMRILISVMYANHARSAISLVKPVNPKSLIHAQKRHTSEARPSIQGWRGWHARLTILNYEQYRNNTA